MTRPQGGRIAEIEFLRGVAIMMVLVEHLPFNLLYWGGPLFTVLWTYGRGWAGVDVFFVISGFVITRALLPGIERTPRRDWLAFCIGFYRRRAWRLLPSAWLWLGIIMIGCVAYNRSGAMQPFDANLHSCLMALFNLENFHAIHVAFKSPTGLAFPYWSLSLEEQFYLVLPIALLLLRRWVAIPVAIMFLTLLLPATIPVYMTRTGGFACGVTLALAFRYQPQIMRRVRPDVLATSRAARALLLTTVIGLLFGLGWETFAPMRIRLLPITLLCAILIWIAAYDQGLLCRAGRLRSVIEWVGSRSYSIYLVHIPVYAAAHETSARLLPVGQPPSGGWLGVYVIGAIAACLVVAEVNYRLVEVPSRRRGIRSGMVTGGLFPRRSLG